MAASVGVRTGRFWLRAVFMLLVLGGASSLAAVPLTLYYKVTGPNTLGQYTYEFELVLDNNDSSWVPTANQGWRWLIFGDQASAPSPLTNFVGNPQFLPIGPWTGYSSSSGGHNGPTLSPVLDYWVPTQLNQSLTWGGTSTANLQQGQLLWSTIAGTQGGAVAANFTVAQRIDVEIEVDATPGTATSVFADEQGPGNAGFVAGTFTLTNKSSAQPGELNSITIQGSGTGNHTTAYQEFALWREESVNPGFDPATDALIGSVAFSGSPPVAVFNLTGGERDFGPSEMKKYYLVAKLNNTASPGETYSFIVSALDITPPAIPGGVPSATMNGFEIRPPEFVFTDNSPSTQGVAFAGAGPAVLQQFTVGFPAGPPGTLNSITLTGVTQGGNLQTDFVSLSLYRDVDNDGQFDSNLDTQVDTLGGFNASNSATFTLSGTESQFAANDLRQYFIVARFEATTPNFSTFATQITAAIGAQGAVAVGLPAPASGPSAGVEVLASNLHITLDALAAPATVNHDEQGPGGAGLVIWSGTAATLNDPWTVTSFTFEGRGTGNPLAAFNYLRLYEDTTGNGTFDPGVDQAAGPEAAGFDSAGRYVATLTGPNFAAQTQRRFFLVAKLAATAFSGETLGAALIDVNGSGPPGGVVSGAVGDPYIALVIDLPSVVVTAGPNNPAAYTHKAGSADAVVIAQLRLRAGNDNANVSSLALQTSGTGSWSSHFAQSNGVELWLDDGDGVFDSTADTLLYTGNVGATIGGAFNSTVSIANGESRFIWVRVHVLDTAGLGEATPLTHRVEVAAPSAVNAGGAVVVLGVPAPESKDFSVVEFFVTTFTPTSDRVGGGKPIMIEGSGFSSPFQVRIGGAVAPGTASITGGTQVIGLEIPPGGGRNLVIEIDSGTLPTQVLTQTFTYSSVGSASGSGGGCAIGAPALPILAVLFGLYGLLRRRRS